MSRKIETGCYAMIRHTGEVVVVGKKYPGYLGGAATFDTLIGGVSQGEYTASELRHISPEEYAKLEITLEEKMLRKCGF